jgi:hypothetical protein
MAGRFDLINTYRALEAQKQAQEIQKQLDDVAKRSNLGKAVSDNTANAGKGFNNYTKPDVSSGSPESIQENYKRAHVTTPDGKMAHPITYKDAAKKLSDAQFWGRLLGNSSLDGVIVINDGNGKWHYEDHGNRAAIDRDTRTDW